MGYCVMTHEVIEELLERGLVDEESYVCRDALNLLSVAVLMGDGTINISNFRKSIGTLVSRNDTLLQTTIVDMLCATGSFDDLTPSWLQQAYSGNDAMLKCAVLRYSHAWSGLDKSASDLCDELTTMAMHDPAFIVRREARRLAVMTDVDNAAIPGDRDINEFDSSDNDTDMLRHFLMGDMDGVNSGCCTNSVVDDLECEEGHLHMECE